MDDDDVLKEIRATREAFARAHDYDARAMVATLRAMNERDDWPVVTLAPRPPVRTLRRPKHEPIVAEDAQPMADPSVGVGPSRAAGSGPTPRVH